MKLKSPHTDPYSKESMIKQELDQKGYGNRWRILDDKKLADGKGNHYLNSEVSIDRIYRQNLDNNDVIYKEGSYNKAEFYALSGNDGNKGHVERRANDDSLEVLDQFLAKVAHNTKLSTHYY